MRDSGESEVAASAAVETVRGYLRLMEERELDDAAELLGSDVTITFPGGREFKSLEEQVASSGSRFRAVRKTFEQFDTARFDDRIVVYVFGTLDGIALDGGPFTGVRFLDRFELCDGLIVSQMVWNDLAETGVVDPTN